MIYILLLSLASVIPTPTVQSSQADGPVCTDVASELDEAIATGVLSITLTERDRIVDRCIQNFGD